MSPLKPLSRSDFRVAIICALSSEFDAVYNVLDRCWDDDERTYQKAAGDTNTYTTGVIGNHNVVVCLSDMGTIQASMAAGSLRLSFPNIDLVLIVGVCGGVPRLPSCSGEIYLGDLVISSQIIEYDFGRQYSDRFERKTSFGNSRSGPVPEIRKFLKTLDTTRRRQQMRDELIRNMRMLREKGIHVAYPGAERDQLYPPEFIHKHRRGICEICDGSTRGCESATRETCGSLGCTDAENITIRYGRTVEPEGQESEHIPNIHIGPIGCGDTVMKSATHRDRIAGRDDIIAFEMEGAGICEQFPSIIIKGVCDYADSHKNKEWQPYAAAISAIGMKALLKQWGQGSTAFIPWSVQVAATSGDHANLVTPVGISQMPMASRDSILNLMEALEYDHRLSRSAHIYSQPIVLESFDWVWSTPFKKWLTQSWGVRSTSFWIAGKPGSGKSTLMKTLVDSQKTLEYLKSVDKSFRIVEFFFDYSAGSSTANNRIGVLKMFIRQLCEHDKDIKQILALQNEHDPIASMDEERLMKLWCNTLRTAPIRICAFIDGLDEYSGDYTDLVYFLEKLQAGAPIQMCLASRPEPTFASRFAAFPQFTMEKHNADGIRRLIDHALNEATDKIDNQSVLKGGEVRDDLVLKAKGVFIWARLAVEELVLKNKSGVSQNDLKGFIDKLPEDLEQMYERTFMRIPQEEASEAALLLFFLNEIRDGSRESLGRTNLSVLYGFWHFFYLEHKGELPCCITESTKISTLATFRRRLQRLLGPFIDFIPVFLLIAPKRYRRKSAWVVRFLGKVLRSTRKVRCLIRRYRKCRVEVQGSVPKGYVLECWGVQLLHNTLHPYLNRSKAVRACLPREFRNRYPDAIMSRIYAGVIASATQALRPKGHVFIKTLDHVAWKYRMDLLEYSIHCFPMEARYEDDTAKDIYDVWKQALSSQYLRHFYPPGPAHGGSIQSRPWPTPYSSLNSLQPIDFSTSPEHLHILLASRFGLLHFFQEALEREMSTGNGRIPSQTFHECLLEAIEALSQGTKETQVARLIDIIQAKCTEIPFDVLMHIIRRNFTQRYYSVYTINKLLYSLRSRPLGAAPSSDKPQCDCRLYHHPLVWWITTKYSYNYDGQEKDPSRPSAEEISTMDLLILSIAIQHDSLVHGVCSKYGNALHYLIVLLNSYAFGWFVGFRILIVLARLGSDPNIKHQGKTPLEMMKDQKRKEQERLERRTSNWLVETNKNSNREKGILSLYSLIIESLEHHRINGSWPDFAALIEEWDAEHPNRRLDHPMLHAVSVDGHIDLDRFRPLYLEDHIDETPSQ